jgi:hypothetical protein
MVLLMRRSKYGAVKTVVDGVTFDSKAEAKRYGELKLLQAAGEIKGLELQPRYDITINDKFCAFYKADFRYIRDSAMVVEDVKGMKTPVYNLKKKLVEALYPHVEIMEITK